MAKDTGFGTRPGESRRRPATGGLGGGMRALSQPFCTIVPAVIRNVSAPVFDSAAPRSCQVTTFGSRPPAFRNRFEVRVLRSSGVQPHFWIIRWHSAGTLASRTYVSQIPLGVSRPEFLKRVSCRLRWRRGFFVDGPRPAARLLRDVCRPACRSHARLPCPLTKTLQFSGSYALAETNRTRAFEYRSRPARGRESCAFRHRIRRRGAAPEPRFRLRFGSRTRSSSPSLLP
jgi:hypothetical protein